MSKKQYLVRVDRLCQVVTVVHGDETKKFHIQSQLPLIRLVRVAFFSKLLLLATQKRTYEYERRRGGTECWNVRQNFLPSCGIVGGWERRRELVDELQSRRSFVNPKPTHFNQIWYPKSTNGHLLPSYATSITSRESARFQKYNVYPRYNRFVSFLDFTAFITCGPNARHPSSWQHRGP